MTFSSMAIRSVLPVIAVFLSVLPLPACSESAWILGEQPVTESGVETRASPEGAGQLVEALLYPDQYEAMHTSCIKGMRQVSLKDFLLTYPQTDRPNIAPGTPQWKQLENSYNRYIEASCATPTRTEFLDVVTSVYQKELSANQLEEILAFYQSDAGRALLAAQKTLAVRLGALLEKEQMEKAIAAAQALDDEVKRIAGEESKRSKPRPDDEDSSQP